MLSSSTDSVFATINTNVFGYGADWLLPDQTESLAYVAAQAANWSGDTIYVGFPWYTLVEKMLHHPPGLEIFLATLHTLSAELPKSTRRITVWQHHLLAPYTELLHTCGVTDVFWPHKSLGSDEIDGIRVHSFPIFPIQTTAYPPRSSDDHRPYKVTFVGAFEPDLYPSRVRMGIFDKRERLANARIVNRGRWHFHHQVVEEQLRGQPLTASMMDQAIVFCDLFLQGLFTSDFCFCPTGRGLATARIYESLAAGCIPVVLSQTVDLPGDKNAWQSSAIFVEDSDAGLEEAIELINAATVEEVVSKRHSCRTLFQHVSPSNYGSLMISTLGKVQK